MGESEGSGSDSSSDESAFTGDGLKPKKRKRTRRPWTDKVVKQMMFVSGETQEPTPETTTLVEQIVKEQVKELVSIKPVP
jgi:hypothetical protein